MCDLYPKSREKLKATSLKKHDLFIKYMKKMERVRGMKFGEQIKNKNEMENLKNFNGLIKRLLEEQNQLKMELLLMVNSSNYLTKNLRTYHKSFLTPYFALFLLFFSRKFLKYSRYSKKFCEKIAKNMPKSVIKKDL